MLYYRCGTPVTAGSEFKAWPNDTIYKIISVNSNFIEYRKLLDSQGELHVAEFKSGTHLGVKCYKTNTVKINHDDLWE